MILQIFGGAPQDVRLVLERAQACVAMMAEERANGARLVVVVDVEPALACRRAATYGAQAALTLKARLEFVD